MSYKPHPTCHAHYFDSTAQAIASASTAQIISFDGTVEQLGITKGTGTGSVANSRFTLPSTGIYAFFLTSTVDSTAGAGEIRIWFRAAASGGTPADIANSTVLTAVNVAVETTLSSNLFYNATAVGHIVEVWMSGDATTTRINATAAGASPTRPAAPSVILTINRISK